MVPRCDSACAFPLPCYEPCMGGGRSQFWIAPSNPVSFSETLDGMASQLIATCQCQGREGGSTPSWTTTDSVLEVDVAKVETGGAFLVGTATQFYSVEEKGAMIGVSCAENAAVYCELNYPSMVAIRKDEPVAWWGSYSCSDPELTSEMSEYLDDDQVLSYQSGSGTDSSTLVDVFYVPTFPNSVMTAGSLEGWAAHYAAFDVDSSIIPWNSPGCDECAQAIAEYNIRAGHCFPIPSNATPPPSYTKSSSTNQNPSSSNQMLSGLEAVSCGSFVSGTVALAGQEVRYRFTPPPDVRTIDINTCSDNTSFDTIVGVSDASGTTITTNDDNLASGCRSLRSRLVMSRPEWDLSVIHEIFVKGYSTHTGDFELQIVCAEDTTPVPTPAPTLGQSVGCNSVVYGSIPAPGAIAPFKFIRPDMESFSMEINTCNQFTSFDTIIEVVDSNNNTIAENDDANDDVCRALRSRLVLDATESQQVHQIVVSAYASTFVGGQFELSVICVNPPPSALPSMIPSNSVRTSTNPSVVPANDPSSFPSLTPSNFPSLGPTTNLSSTPSNTLSGTPSETNALLPSTIPSFPPSQEPPSLPTSSYSSYPSLKPSSSPSKTRTAEPSFAASSLPSTLPSVKLSHEPSVGVYNPDTELPTSSPTGPVPLVSDRPSSVPSDLRSTHPSLLRSDAPSTSLPYDHSVDPSSSPTFPSSSSSPSVTPVSTGCDITVMVDITLDFFASEIRWLLMDTEGGIEVASKVYSDVDDFQSYVETVEVQMNTLYSFVIFDSGGDGMLPPAGFRLSYAVTGMDSVVVAERFPGFLDFDAWDAIEYDFTTPNLSCTPSTHAPSSSPTESSFPTFAHSALPSTSAAPSQSPSVDTTINNRKYYINEYDPRLFSFDLNGTELILSGAFGKNISASTLITTIDNDLSETVIELGDDGTIKAMQFTNGTDSSQTFFRFDYQDDSSFSVEIYAPVLFCNNCGDSGPTDYVSPFPFVPGDVNLWENITLPPLEYDNGTIIPLPSESPSRTLKRRMAFNEHDPWGTSIGRERHLEEAPSIPTRLFIFTEECQVRTDAVVTAQGYSATRGNFKVFLNRVDVGVYEATFAVPPAPLTVDEILGSICAALEFVATWACQPSVMNSVRNTVCPALLATLVTQNPPAAYRVFTACMSGFVAAGTFCRYKEAGTVDGSDVTVVNEVCGGTASVLAPFMEYFMFQFEPVRVTARATFPSTGETSINTVQFYPQPNYVAPSIFLYTQGIPGVTRPIQVEVQPSPNPSAQGYYRYRVYVSAPCYPNDVAIRVVGSDGLDLLLRVGEQIDIGQRISYKLPTITDAITVTVSDPRLGGALIVEELAVVLQCNDQYICCAPHDQEGFNCPQLRWQ